MNRTELLLTRAAFILVCVTAVGVLLRTLPWMLDGAWAYVRPWGTVLASLGMLGGAVAALRGRVWGILLVGAAATSFAGAHAMEIAPAWFLGIAAVGWVAVATTVRPLLRMDAAAAVVAVLAVLALGTGAAILAGPGVALVMGY